jgi:sulfate/thiosulfate-binding protein
MFRQPTRRLMARGAGVLCCSAVSLAMIVPGSARAAGTTLTLVAYSTPQTAYGQIITAFNKTSAGKDVTFQQSYGASGDQANAVANGLHADIVNFSLEPDMAVLVKKGMVKGTWYKNAYHGFVTDSVVVFSVRKGNPKHIHTWNDLIKKGVNVVTPNPFTSGGARWNIMAAYGAQIAQHKTKKRAVAYLQKLFANVSVQDDSARKSLATFSEGEGDVLLGYQNEALAAQKAGVSLQIIVPPQSILIENPAAMTTESKAAKTANAFLNFLYSRDGQTIFARNGYWPVRKDVAKHYHFARPKKLFTIRSLGSWPRVQKQFFDPRSGIMASIERKKGVNP